MKKAVGGSAISAAAIVLIYGKQCGVSSKKLKLELPCNLAISPFLGISKGN
jgi:hypothetical protein